MLAWLHRPCGSTRTLMLAGLGLSLAFVDGPYVSNFALRSAIMAGTSLLVMIGVAAMVHFLLLFPNPRPWAGRSPGRVLIYLPALLLWLLVAYRVLFTPESSTALTSLTNLMAGAITGVYLLFSLYLLLRNYSKTNALQRKAQALNLMLLGTVLGILPVLIAQLVTAFSPHAALPGQAFYFVSLALIPLSWAHSTWRVPAVSADEMM
jgi:hypothetical protein